jgi:hypothetical protein
LQRSRADSPVLGVVAENDQLGVDKSLPNPRYLFIDR